MVPSFTLGAIRGEDQLAALGPVLNSVVLWNTRYLDAAVAQLRAEGQDIRDEDVARLSPLKDLHINFLDRYLFHSNASGPGQGLRPFRDPDDTEDDEDGRRRSRPAGPLVASRGGQAPDAPGPRRGTPSWAQHRLNDLAEP